MPESAITPEPNTVLGVGGRLATGPAPELVNTAFARELADQLSLFKGMSMADLAHTIMLIEAGVIPAEAGRELLTALLILHDSPSDFTPNPALGDLYTNREAWLAAHTEATGWLGAGRARRESTTTGYRLAVRSRLLAFATALGDAAVALLDLAETHQTGLMADYTYLQPAQPTTFSHYLFTFIYPIWRDLDRLQALFTRINLSPAGCGSVNGSRIPQDRHRLAELLGFDGLIPHARDAMWQPDGPIETLAMITAAMINLDRLAEDLQIFATAEFDLIELADGHTRASVIMPQKKNPYALTYIRGVANELTGNLASAAAFGRTPSGQVDNRVFIYGSLPRSLESATGAAALMAGVVRGIRFNAPLAAARLADTFAGATDLAEIITLETGLDFRSAHRVVGRLVRDSLTAGRRASEVTPADVNAAAQVILGRPLHLSVTTLKHALDPALAVMARQGVGSAAPASLNAMVAECRTALLAHSAWYKETTLRINVAETALLSRARVLST